jgi:hypothetical protein
MRSMQGIQARLPASLGLKRATVLIEINSLVARRAVLCLYPFTETARQVRARSPNPSPFKSLVQDIRK